MKYLKRIAQVFCVSSMALLFAGAHAADDAGSKSQSGTNGAATQSTTSSTSTTNGAAGASGATSKSATLSDKDQGMMKDIAEANIAEIRTGKEALQKSTNPEIQKFAQMMIDDHTKANDELQKLAQSKGITLPQETDFQHKAAATGLRALSGNAFDKAYINLVGRSDHKRTQQLLQKTQQQAQDPDLRAYAQKTLQTVNQHVDQANSVKNKMQSKGQKSE